MNSDSYKAHWRAAANDAVPYCPKDFPEWYALTVELLNGGKKPSIIQQRLNLSGGKAYYRYRDDGEGCTIAEANARLLQWAAVAAVDGKSVYGHGTKKFLAKCGEYDTLSFKIRSRAKGERKIVEWSAPYLGLDTHYDIVEIPDFPRHGFEIEVEISREKLGTYTTPEKAFEALKEIVCARKQQSLLSSVAFEIEVQANGVTVKKEDSKTHGWKSFQETIATDPACKLLLHKVIPFVEGKVMLEYDSYTTGVLACVPGFPVYGTMTGGVGTRIHISNEDTMIEAHSWYDIRGLRVHPSMWHRVDFARFVPVDPTNREHILALPAPATTKVQYRHESVSWQTFKDLVNKTYEENKKALELPSKESLKSPQVSASAVSSPVVRAARASASASSSATPFFTARPSPSDVTSVTESAPVEAVPLQTFENTTLNELYIKYQAAGKHPERHPIPSWLGCKEDLLIYQDNGKTNLVFYRQRVKGSLSEDIEKAYVVLARYANERKLPMDKIQMIFCLHVKSGIRERNAEFELVKKKMNSGVYPYINCLQLKLLKDM